MTTSAVLLLLAGVQAGPDRIDLDPSQMTLDAEETVTVTATVRSADGAVLADAPVRWIAMNPEVAVVDQSGQVTAVSPGEARIAARSGNVMSFAAVVVRALPVASLVAELPEPTLLAGTSAPLRVVAVGREGEPVTDPVLTFSSSDESVAGVDAAGRVHARSAGQARVTVAAGSASAVVTVTVQEGELGAVEVIPAEVRARTGDVIALSGEVGAGKTTFARFFIRALGGADEDVPSPTFTLAQSYALAGAEVWHFDLYRLEAPEEAYELGIEEAFAHAISLIEWPERLGSLLPPESLEVRLEIGPAEAERTALVRASGDWSVRLGALDEAG